MDVNTFLTVFNKTLTRLVFPSGYICRKVIFIHKIKLKMRKKALAIGLSLLFFGSMTTSTFAMSVANINQTVVVDDDDDKKKTSTTKTTTTKATKSECDSKKSSECCSSKKSSCDDKKGEDKR